MLDGIFNKVGLFTGAGAAFDDTTVSCYDADELLLGIVAASLDTGGDVFAGWYSAGGIASIRIDGDPDNNYVTSFDRLHREVTVSEPVTLALLGLGLAGIGMTRRKKKV